MTALPPSAAAAFALLDEVEEALLTRRQRITAEQAYALADLVKLAPHEDSGVLGRMLDLAHRVRLAWCGEEVSLESILSTKTGGCPEDCAFCSQSATFQAVKPQPYLATEDVLNAALDAQASGATEFCMVLAIKGPDDKAMAHILESVAAVRDGTQLEVAVSAGLLTREQAQQLADAGVVRYNHNLESAASYFPQICSTHTWDERYDTCQHVRETGMELCSGGILGMGETARQRAELALALAELEPCEVPVNFLNPRPGTPLQDSTVLDAARRAARRGPVPADPAVGDAALRRRPRGRAGRPPGRGHPGRRERADRRQLPHDPGPQPRRGHRDAGRPAGPREGADRHPVGQNTTIGSSRARSSRSGTTARTGAIAARPSRLVSSARSGTVG